MLEESKSELLDFIRLYETLLCNSVNIEKDLNKKKFVVITTIIKHNWKID